MSIVKSILLFAVVAAGIPISVAAQTVADTQSKTSQQSNGSHDAKDAVASSQHDPANPARRTRGLGYPYHELNRGAYRARGYGYGRGRRGYGYGYPGYRGQGGTPYRQHRQYGNPPFYSVSPMVDTPPAVQE